MADQDNSSVDGFDGIVYDRPFQIPTYDNSSAVFNALSWHDIDLFYESNASSTLLNAVGFTICLVSLLYVLALTPSSKRRMRIHTFLVLALVFKIIDRSIALSLLLHSPNVSAYINLTLDVTNIDLSADFKAKVSALQAGNILTFVCLQACLYIHGQPLLTLIRLGHKVVYRVLLTYLITSGLLAFAMRLVLAVLVLVNIDKPLGPAGARYQSIYQAAIITIAISIASWSLVFFISSIKILLQRRKQLVSQNRLYESVLNMIAIVGLESFILPLTFAILQLVPRINTILSNSPEVLLIPSVLLVLPLASVFGSSRAGQLTQSPVHTGRSSENDGSTLLVSTGRNPSRQQENHIPRPSKFTRHGKSEANRLGRESPLHPLELELRSIDKMEVV